MPHREYATAGATEAIARRKHNQWAKATHIFMGLESRQQLRTLSENEQIKRSLLEMSAVKTIKNDRGRQESKKLPATGNDNNGHAKLKEETAMDTSHSLEHLEGVKVGVFRAVLDPRGDCAACGGRQPRCQREDAILTNQRTPMTEKRKEKGKRVHCCRHHFQASSVHRIARRAEKRRTRYTSRRLFSLSLPVPYTTSLESRKIATYVHDQPRGPHVPYR